MCWSHLLSDFWHLLCSTFCWTPISMSVSPHLGVYQSFGGLFTCQLHLFMWFLPHYLPWVWPREHRLSLLPLSWYQYYMFLFPSHVFLRAYGLLPRYGDMRKEIGFRIRDMWYNLGKCTIWTPLLVLHASHDEVFFILIPFNSVKMSF